jgi:hypothetical protein
VKPNSQNTQQTEIRDEQLLAGISKDLQTMPSLFLGGQAYSPGSLAALIQSRIDAANAVSTTMSAWLAAVHTYQAIDAQTTPVVRDLRNWVQAAFGQTAPELADFGFASHSVAVPPRSRGRRPKAKARKSRKAAQ